MDGNSKIMFSVSILGDGKSLPNIVRRPGSGAIAYGSMVFIGWNASMSSTMGSTGGTIKIPILKRYKRTAGF